MELQDYIMNMACRQVIRELGESDLWKVFMSEMFLYNLVKRDWGLGHIRLRIVDKFDIETRPFSRYCNPLTFYVEVNGYYVDLEGRKSLMFIGNGYDGALRRMKHVKSFL